jgi:hypothetical protein
MRDLALLGDAAARALDKLLSSPDAELVGRARRALAMIDRASRLPRSLVERAPSVLERDFSLQELLALARTPDEEAFFSAQAAKTPHLLPSTWYRFARFAPISDLLRVTRSAPNPTMRAYALAALQVADAKTAYRVALELLRSPFLEVRVQAAFTIGDVGPKAAASELKRLLTDPSPVIAVAAELAIRRLVLKADVPRRAGVGLPFTRLEQLAIYAAACDGRAIETPVAFTPVPLKKDAPRPSLAWTNVLDAISERTDLKAELQGKRIVFVERKK